MWEALKQVNRPLVLYGTGNGAQRICEELARRGMEPDGVFASSGFVRHRSFLGLPVLSYEEAKARFGPMTVLLCFGTALPAVRESILTVAREQDLYVPDVPVVGDGVFDRRYYEAHKARFDELRSRLADDESRRVLDEVLAFKLTGRPEHLFACESPAEENDALLPVGQEEVYWDLGAYTGDTLVAFLRRTARYRQLLAMEPDGRNFRKLSQQAAGLPDCHLLQAAIAEKPGEIPFSRNNGRGGALGKGPCAMVPAESVDHLVSQPGLLPPTLLKLDVEGQESAAIAGAEQTIRTYKPKLLVSAYHRVEDLWALPLQLLALREDYHLYLRRNPCIPAWELNYYLL